MSRLISTKSAALLMFAAIIAIVPVSIYLVGAQPATQPNQNLVQASPATLYFHPNCPHCHKVMDYLKGIHKTVAIKDISNPMYKKELQSYGQKGVPVLVVGTQVIVG